MSIKEDGLVDQSTLNNNEVLKLCGFLFTLLL